MNHSWERFHLFSQPLSEPTPALFLDRDGVVIEDQHHLSDPSQVHLCLGARELIATAHRHDWPVVLVTNQSGIARGLFSWADVEKVNKRVQVLLGVDSPLAAIYVNGYGPDAPINSWRKPNPQMLLKASRDLNLDLQRSVLIGDRLSDLQAGAAAGLAMVLHVLSGHGRSARESVLRWYEHLLEADPAFNDLAQHLPELRLLDGLDSFPFDVIEKGK